MSGHGNQDSDYLLGRHNEPMPENTRAPAGGSEPTDLHAAIMNLPCKPEAGWTNIEKLTYKIGHRDARHAAAELVASAPASAPLTVFDELIAFSESSETKPTFADAVRIALAAKQRECLAAAPVADERAKLRAALQEATDALAGGLWDYGPGQDEHDKCNEVIQRCRAALSGGSPEPLTGMEPDRLGDGMGGEA